MRHPDRCVDEIVQAVHVLGRAQRLPGRHDKPAAASPRQPIAPDEILVGVADGVVMDL